MSIIDCVLSQNAGDFDIFTAAVANITIKVRSGCAKSASQALTYITRPLDLIIQLACSPIFALYQTGKSVKNAFDYDLSNGITKLALSPFYFAINILMNLYSTKFISTPFNTVVPISLVKNMLAPLYAAGLEVIQMNEKYPFMFNDYFAGEKKNVFQRRLVNDGALSLVNTLYFASP